MRWYIQKDEEIKIWNEKGKLVYKGKPKKFEKIKKKYEKNNEIEWKIIPKILKKGV